MANISCKGLSEHTKDKQNELKCGTCPQSFTQNGELEHHIKDTHPTFTATNMTNNKLLNMKQHL